VAILSIAGLVLLTSAIVCLIPVAFIGDPAEGGYDRQRVVVAMALTLSFVLGASAMLLFIRAIRMITGGYVAARRLNVMRGVVLVVSAVLLYWLGFVQIRSPLLLLTFPVSLLMLYLGGGFLLASFNRPN
jgi:hypothetical protein